jgi:NAD(P)-dependent dehydrogenase (short-subunit alcohol dehydrogenase family)
MIIRKGGKSRKKMNQPIIIITGASRGLGAAAAKSAAQLGAGIVLAARSAEHIERAAEEIRRAGGQALAVTADVGQEAGCEQIVSRALAEFGRIDGLINNAGVIEPIGPIAETSAGDWLRSWEVNVLAAVTLTRLALPALRRAKGRVVNISSGAAAGRIPGWGAYSISKAALNTLTQVLAGEEPEITAIALRPGVVDTQMQVTIRQTGRGKMAVGSYDWLTGLHQQGKLLPVEIPGRVMASLALFTPHEWSGETLQWDDAKVQELVKS